MTAADVRRGRSGIVGILLAAGRSRRMGCPKLLLRWPPPLGRSTVVAAAFDLIAPWCERVVVVIGAEPRAIADALEGRTFETVRGDPDADMLDSARRGFEAVRGAETILLQPGDHPAGLTSTIDRVLAALDAPRVEAEAAREAGSAATDRPAPAPMVAMPEHAGRGGHPVAIRGALLDRILGWRGVGGLAGLWRTLGDAALRVPVDDSACVLDLDRPEDYAGAIASITTPEALRRPDRASGGEARR
ncbi:MAG TPA: NTP transferase domain-containing protein [Phycisphaerales bacterium]|nr:NTP transferase domain-containing protein [Phycisphaerales bacterium]HMP38603.1 NTP transferase domain-containing protein [Phycisphaerales bacterium]